MQSPEELAREKIDASLEQCGWILQNRSTINFSAARGIAIREGLLKGDERTRSANVSRCLWMKSTFPSPREENLK